MILQPFTVTDATLAWYRRYVRASFPLRDTSIDAERERLIGEGLLWADPHVALARPGNSGPTLADLGHLLAPETISIPWGFERLYQHQARAIERLVVSHPQGPQNTLALSGTGSGKTESFLIPVVDACLRDPSPGVKAVVIYPMNALANDQLGRLRHLLAGTGVTFGRYTGDTPETEAGDARREGRPADATENLRWSRQVMRDQPPAILLTNYSMLEYILLRGKDEELFRFGPPKYLIVDEIHLFSGVLGAEVGALLRRLRQHTDPAGKGLCMVGTSATAGSESETEELRNFAERFFGAPFGPDSLIAETPAPFAPRGSIVPALPCLVPELVSAAATTEGLAELGRETLGIDLPADENFPEKLGEVIDQFATVSVVEHALARPAPLSEAARVLSQLPERSEATENQLMLEAQAILLLGAAARVVTVGEDAPQPRFRPRVHQMVRSLAGLWRCTDPAHSAVRAPGGGRCICGAIALPLASCRTCGEAYWSSPVQAGSLDAISRLYPVELERGDPAVFVADPNRLHELVGEDEEGNAIAWRLAHLCPYCGAFSIGGHALAHTQACPRPIFDGVKVVASTDNVHCPACGSQGARNRPVLLPLKGSAAASVAVLARGLSDQLRSEGGDPAGRLLVFADSRQNAAQQAGYSDDQGARVAIRQLIAGSVTDEGRLSLPALAKRVVSQVTENPETLQRWLVGEAARDFKEVSAHDYLPSTEDRKRISNQLEWEVALELTERARRRFSLEQEGVVAVTLDKLDELSDGVARTWPANPFGVSRLSDVILAFADVLRYGRAVSHWLLIREPRALVKNHSVRIGDFAVTATRGYARKKYRSRQEGLDIRAWTDPKHPSRLTELTGRLLGKKPTEVNGTVDALVSRLTALGVFADHKVSGRNRSMLDHNRLEIALRGEKPLWRCDRCGTVRASLLRDSKGNSICVNWHCPGTPRPFNPPAERDFYRNQYAAPSRRLIVREHSGQISGDTRLALEAAFNNPQRSLVDVLACTPTLEVGVSLDDLHATVLRNLPPTPANYAQRVGRAGRRSKVALALAHAGHGPHDTYFFERPAEMITGEVKAPTISLDNKPLLRRHVNSLIFEVLGVDLPTRWVPAPDGSTPPEEETIADRDGVLKESTIKPFADKLANPGVRTKAEASVRGAFASPSDPAPPADVETFCIGQVDRFVDELRRALKRWSERYRALVEEYKKAQAAPGIPSPTEKQFQDRLYREIVRLAEPSSPEYQPLGFLGLVGFLPRYGFTADSVFLHPAGSDEPIVQAAPVAVTEFAPGNVVYARGRRLKVRRLDPAPVEESAAGPEHRDNVISQGRRCDACEYFTVNPLEKSCPTCGRDLIGQAVLGLTGVYASGGAISSEDEYRRRSDYELRHLLGAAQDVPSVVELGGLHIEHSHGRAITVANLGPRRSDGTAPLGFELCAGCGYAGEATDDEDDPDSEDQEASGHKPYCPARKDPKTALMKRNVWLTARLQGDALEIMLPPAARGPGFESWRITLAEALLLGIRETMQAGPDDLDWFERRRNGEPLSLVLYDTMPGGTGYIPKLFAGEGSSFKTAALEAGRRVATCDCSDSCHRCLRDFWNQRYHHQLNRFEVFGTLQRLADAEIIEGLDPEDEKLESFLEREFFDRLSAAGLPLPTLQVVRVVGQRRIIRVDCEYRDPDVSIFLDGRAWHTQSLDKIVDDLEVRNNLEARGVCVLEYTYGDIMANFDAVAIQIRTALDGRDQQAAVDLSTLPGLEVKDTQPTTKRALVAVDAAAWAKNETTRRESLNSGNEARLAGWRLRRVPKPAHNE